MNNQLTQTELKHLISFLKLLQEQTGYSELDAKTIIKLQSQFNKLNELKKEYQEIILMPNVDGIELDIDNECSVCGGKDNTHFESCALLYQNVNDICTCGRIDGTHTNFCPENGVGI